MRQVSIRAIVWFGPDPAATRVAPAGKRAVCTGYLLDINEVDTTGEHARGKQMRL